MHLKVIRKPQGTATVGAVDLHAERQEPLIVQLVREVAGAHEPVLVAVEREAVAALEVRHARLDLNEDEPPVLECRVPPAAAGREGHEVDPMVRIDPDLLRDEGELPAELLRHLLGQLFSHVSARHLETPSSRCIY